MTARAYPLPRPESGEDPRFTFGLILDIGKVLEAHGYPPITDGVDFVDLQMAIFRFVYGTTDRPDGSPLTLAEYRSALAHWERKASEAQASGDQAAIAYRTQGIEALRRATQRLEAAERPEPGGDYPHPLPA